MPGNLTQAGEEGTVLAEMMKNQLNAITAKVQELGGFWQSLDYYTLSGYTENHLGGGSDVPKLNEAINAIFTNLSAIAGAYSKFQEQTIEKMQNIQL